MSISEQEVRPNPSSASTLQSGLSSKGPRRRNMEDIHLDHLTGIGNRKFFEGVLVDEVKTCSSDAPSSFVLLLLDLDRFKAVNDSLGHAVGDTLLRLVAERMSQAIGPTDEVARLGGDEFGILTRRASSVTDLASRLLDVVQRPYLIEGCPINIGLSIGFAVYPGDGIERDQLFRRADLALYQAKSSGRSCFFHFQQHMEIEAGERRQLELDLRKAIPLRQMDLLYKPQVDVATKRLMSLDGLLVWRHPKKGVLNSSKFFSLAEEIGVIVPIGEWVLKTACAEASKWPADVTISIVVSPLQFETERFFEAVQRNLLLAKLDGNRLELAMTESVLLRDGKELLLMLNRLRGLGVKVAIDGFGTGIASLSQMVAFPLDKIKINRTLTGEGDGKHRAIVRAIAALGAGLGVSTLAEGVSTQEQLARIQQDGCSSVRGYFSSDAVPGAELKALIQELSTQTTESESGKLNDQ